MHNIIYIRDTTCTMMKTAHLGRSTAQSTVKGYATVARQTALPGYIIVDSQSIQISNRLVCRSVAG